MIKSITPQELKRQLEQHSILLIDVREPAEHASQRIEGAWLIPMQSLCCQKLPSTQKPIVLHCAAGKRSEMAAQKLLAENPGLDIYSLAGGITAWQQAGFAVQAGKRHVLPVDRQTQLVIGSVVLFGSLLAVTVSPWFALLPITMGTGLMIAGSTGWCGLAKLLARMPWNR